MNSVQILSQKINTVKRITNELLLYKDTDPEILHGKLILLKKKFQEFTKLTNAGKASQELRKEKLKVLKIWLDNYDDPAQVAIKHLPKKYLNKNITLPSRTLQEISYFKYYIELIIEYMEKLEPRFLALKEKVISILEKDNVLKQHINKFLISPDDVPDLDLLAAEDNDILGDLPEVAPAKMIATIQSILKKYHSFSLLVAEKYKDIISLIQELDNIDLGEFLSKVNIKNKLIQQLLRNLIDINKILYQEKDLKYKPLLREKYYRLVEECITVFPQHIGEKVLSIIEQHKGKEQLQEAIEGSLGGINKYMPEKDPLMTYQSPHIVSYKPKEKLEEPLEERIDRKLRHQDLAEVSQRPGASLSPEEKNKYEELWSKSNSNNRELLKISKAYKIAFNLIK